MLKSKGAVVGLVVLGLVIVAGNYAIGTYNRLVELNQENASAWAQVENAYQRRFDLVPNLVETVKGAAKFEKETYTDVTEARARASSLRAASTPTSDPAAFERYQRAQDDLSRSLGRLMVVVEGYPDLKATANFRDLQTQLEGTENRIAVERMRFNDSSEKFNAYRQSFPQFLLANLLGARFTEKPYFRARADAASPPQVRFE
jgi:LemA protein